MNVIRTCLRMRRYPGIISSAQHAAAPPARSIAVKAHKSRRKSENDVFKCILSPERGGPDPLDPPPPLVSAPAVILGHCITHGRHETCLNQLLRYKIKLEFFCVWLIIIKVFKGLKRSIFYVCDLHIISSEILVTTSVTCITL